MIAIARSDGRFSFPGREMRCAIGRGGMVPAAAKREGDGASPVGIWPIRRVLWRPDRLEKPFTTLETAPIGEADGWCDAPEDPAYNRPVSLPYPASHERMWRDDGLYDVVVILGHNDDPPVPGLGSAIFLHCARPDFGPTEGCIALARADLLEMLAMTGPGDALDIRSRL